MQAPVAVAQSPLSQSSLAMYQRPPTAANDGAAPDAKPQRPLPAAEAAAPATEVVSLHGAAEIQAAAAAQQAPRGTAQMPEVFAEIWKDGMRIGRIYTDGQAVMSVNASGMVNGSGSAAIPFLRAQEVSRMVGGEVRLVDLQALKVAQTRSQLHAAYGA